jgi:hypothetical protein
MWRTFAVVMGGVQATRCRASLSGHNQSVIVLEETMQPEGRKGQVLIGRVSFPQSQQFRCRVHDPRVY